MNENEISTKDTILDAALTMAEEIGLHAVTRHGIAKRVGVSYGTIYNHLGGMPETRTEIIKHAVTKRNLRVLAEGIISKHPDALSAPLALKQEALLSLA